MRIILQLISLWYTCILTKAILFLIPGPGLLTSLSSFFEKAKISIRLPWSNILKIQETTSDITCIALWKLLWYTLFSFVALWNLHFYVFLMVINISLFFSSVDKAEEEKNSQNTALPFPFIHRNPTLLSGVTQNKHVHQPSSANCTNFCGLVRKLAHIQDQYSTLYLKTKKTGDWMGDIYYLILSHFLWFHIEKLKLGSKKYTLFCNQFLNGMYLS